jgi:hypothetical protein
MNKELSNGSNGAKDPGATPSNWPPQVWELIEWTATPSKLRDPKTEKALAERLGVSDRTLRNWKKKPGFSEEVRRLCRSLLEDKISEYYYALSQEAMKGSLTHIKLVLELLGEYTEHSDITTGGRPFPVQTYDYGAAIAAITPPLENEGPGYPDRGSYG